MTDINEAYIARGINRKITEAEARLKMMVLENKIFADGHSHINDRARLLKLARGELLTVVDKRDRFQAFAVLYADKSAVLVEWAIRDSNSDEWSSLPNLDDYETLPND